MISWYLKSKETARLNKLREVTPKARESTCTALPWRAPPNVRSDKWSLGYEPTCELPWKTHAIALTQLIFILFIFYNYFKNKQIKNETKNKQTHTHNKVHDRERGNTLKLSTEMHCSHLFYNQKQKTNWTKKYNRLTTETVQSKSTYSAKRENHKG